MKSLISDAVERGEITPELADKWLADRKVIADAFKLSRERRWALVQSELERGAMTFLITNDQ